MNDPQLHQPHTLTRRTVLKAGGGLGLAAAVTGLQWSALTPAEQALAAPGGAVKLNVLFIGAHPDDEAGTLAALGQWNEYNGMKAGVITITRGEGGGNAVGLEEGPPLGMLREAEERTAVGYAGIENVFNLDGLDFYYTASAPLSYDVWGGEAVLNRIVRVVRATRPEVIVTMNPSAVEGNHGNHQQAAMFAVEAYLAAGDPKRFPEHFAEGFQPWMPRRILRSGANGSGQAGEGGVAAGYTPTVASDVVFGCWNGTFSARNDKRWSQMQDLSRWAYVTQGWASFAPTTTDPAKIPNTWFTVIHTRGPVVDPKSGGDAALRGAALAIDGGLPLGTLIDVRPAHFEAVPTQPVAVAVTVSAAAKLAGGRLALTASAGWSVSGPLSVPALKQGASHTATFQVTAPADAAVGTQVRVEATLTVGGASGTTFAQLRVAGAVEASVKPLPEIQEFRDWTAGIGYKHLDVLVPELFAIGQGRTRDLEIVVENFSNQSQSGEVAITMPAGFAVSPGSLPYSGLAAGKTASLGFKASNTDSSIPTANRPANKGSWPVTVHATSALGSADRNVTLNLVPTHAVQRAAAAPVINGVRGEGEYPGDPILVDTIWDGSPMGGTNPTISAKTWITHDDANLYLFLQVKDDGRGTILPKEDNKRQRRTDSVEIYVDPRGTAGNTAQTFIGGIMPSMDSMTGAPGVGRDRDNWQGEAHLTAPGMEVKVVMADTEAAYTGYDMEVKIPFAVLPDNLDPRHVGFNVVVNDSDTQNKAAQNRVGWSTFPGMRADPWRWGILTLDVADKGSKPKAPTLPDTAARSVESPQSILQSAADQVPLGGFSPAKHDLKVLSSSISGGAVTVALQTPRAGTARVYLWDGTKVLGSTVAKVPSGRTDVRFMAVTNATGKGKGDLNGSPAAPVLAVSFEASDGVTATRALLGGRSA